MYKRYQKVCYAENVKIVTRDPKDKKSAKGIIETAEKVNHDKHKVMRIRSYTLNSKLEFATDMTVYIRRS